MINTSRFASLVVRSAHQNPIRPRKDDLISISFSLAAATATASNDRLLAHRSINNDHVHQFLFSSLNCIIHRLCPEGERRDGKQANERNKNDKRATKIGENDEDLSSLIVVAVVVVIFYFFVSFASLFANKINYPDVILSFALTSSSSSSSAACQLRVMSGMRTTCLYIKSCPTRDKT